MENLSIIIPSYNEEKRISKTISSISNAFSKAEIIVVSDGSVDNTEKIVRNLMKKNPNLELIEFEERKGKGKAIIEGFKNAKGEIIGFLDADDAFGMWGIKKLINPLNFEGADCVIASKWKGINFFKLGGRSSRRFAGRIWNLLIKILFQLNFSDTQGGAKFLRRRVLNDIGTDFFCKGFETDVELLWRIKKKGFRIKEVFVKSSFKRESKFKIRRTIPMFLNILKLRIRGVDG